MEAVEVLICKIRREIKLLVLFTKLDIINTLLCAKYLMANMLSDISLKPMQFDHNSDK